MKSRGYGKAMASKDHLLEILIVPNHELSLQNRLTMHLTLYINDLITLTFTVSFHLIVSENRIGLAEKSYNLWAHAENGPFPIRD